MQARFVHYAITDRHVLPPRDHLRNDWKEAAVMLPHAYLVNLHLTPAMVSLSNISFGRVVPKGWARARSEPLACSLNRPNKIEPHRFGLWLDVLRYSHAILWIATGVRKATVRNNQATVSALRAEAAARGLHSSRLVFA